MKIILAFALFTVLVGVKAQVTFEKHFGEIPFSEYGAGMVEAPGGGVYLLATCNVDPIKGSDIWLLKTDIEGDTLWSRKIGGGNDEWATQLLIASNSLIISGTFTIKDSSESDFLCIKTDLEGNLLWMNNYGTIRDDYKTQIIESSDGGYILAGLSADSILPDYNNVLLIKIQATGQLEWQKKLDMPASINNVCLARFSDGTYLLTASTSYRYSADYMIRLTGTGSVIWQNEAYNGLKIDKIASLANDRVLVSGSYYNSFNYLYTPAMTLVDQFGSTLWSHSFPYSSQDFCSIDALSGRENGGALALVYLDNFPDQSQTYLWVVNPEGNSSYSNLLDNLANERFPSTVLEFPDSHVWFSGFSYEIAGAADIILIKSDTIVSYQTNKIYGVANGTGQEGGYSVFPTSDNGYIAAGYKQIWIPGTGWRNNGFVVKVDAQGEFEWDQLLSDTEISESWKVIESENGGYIVMNTGTFLNIYKLDYQGNIVWSTVIHMQPNAAFGGIIEKQDGNIFIGTSLRNPSNNIITAAIVSLSAMGDSTGIYYYHLNEYPSRCYDLISSIDNGFILSGVVTIPSKSGDVLIMKINQNLEMEWANNYGSSEYERSTSIVQTSEGSIYSYGIISSYNPNPYSWIINVNANGDSLHSKIIGDQNQYELWGYKIIKAVGSGFTIISIKNNNPASMNDRFGSLMKLDDELNITWEREFGHSRALIPYDLKTTSDQGYIICGIGFYSFYGNEIYLLKTDENGILTTDENPLNTSLLNINIYPNPSRGQLNVVLDFIHTEKLDLQIIDISGKRLFQQTIPPAKNSNTISIDIPHLASGMYLLQVKTKDFLKTAKFLVCP